MDGKTVAGEPVEVLLAALRQFTWRKTRAGRVRFSTSLDRELGESLLRAITRIERELLEVDRASRHGVNARTLEHRRADAFVALVLRLTEVPRDT